MKKILTITGLVILNLILVAISLIIHNYFTIEIIRTTETPNELEGLILTPILIAGLILFFKTKTFKLYGIGITALIISITIFLVFYCNRSLATKGKYESFEIRNINWDDDGFFLNIGFNMWYNSTEVTQEKCLDVDSIQVRIDKGFFGMQTVTNNLKIVENFNCEEYELDSTNLLRSHLELASELYHKRCFKGSIEHFSNCIILNPTNPSYYYNRGLVFMALASFENAISDFMTSLYLSNNDFDNIIIESTDKLKQKPFTKELLEKFKNKDYSDIGKYINNISKFKNIDTYKTRIEFCVKRMKNK